MGIDFSICIIDCMGNILILEKMDNVKASSVNIARAKAMTALKMNVPTGNIGKMIKEMELDIMFWAGSCETGFAGGFPLYDNESNKFPVGAIGVSGGSQEQDSEVALEGAKVLNLITK
ncbi:MAG: heme-binding protein [Actinobacteria bacterium]|nr:heme-binding protein [Actinomycetota bacterium]